MADYVLEGETWADPNDITWSFFSPGEPTDGIFSSRLTAGIFQTDVINAFAAWAHIADVHFVQLTGAAASTADIRIGWENIDGPGQVLGETYYSFDSASHFTEADIGFDVGEPWAISGGDEKSQGAPFFIVALHEIGHALGLDHYNAQSAVMNAFIDPDLTGLTVHDINGIVALYGPANHAPEVAGANKSLVHGTSVLASTLFSVTDREHDTITEYHFKDLTASASSGHFVLSGVVQAANTTIDVLAADLANLSFVAGASGADTLQVSASDGMHFSAAHQFTVTAINHAPVVTAVNLTATHGQIFTAAELFSASDADGDAIVRYQLLDNTTPSSSGHWDIGGVNEPGALNIAIPAADLGDVTFESGSGKDSLQVRAYDGFGWGAWKTFTVAAPADHLAVVTAVNLTATHGQIFTSAELFSVTDADNDAIVSYQIADNTTSSSSGHWDIGGVNQAAAHNIVVAAADFADLTFESGSGKDSLSVRAYDGFAWGAWKTFSVAAPADHVPVVAATNLVATHGEIFTTAELFSVTDADNDAIVSYQIADNTTPSSSGHWDIGGVNQAAAHNIVVAAADFADLTFESGSGKDSLSVRAYDGFAWGAWKTFSVAAPVDHAPVVTATNLAATHGQVLTASDLFSVGDADGDAIASYQIADNTTSSSSGHWDIGGANQAAGHNIAVAAADLGGLTFESGSGKDSLSVRAFDGELWGAWKTFTVAAPVDAAPVVAGGNSTVALNSHTLASDLFSASDADGDLITMYQLQDNTRGSGHWDVNGVAQAATHPFTVAAADLVNVDFAGGAANGTDHLEVRAYDDLVWGAWHTFNVVTHV